MPPEMLENFKCMNSQSRNLESPKLHINKVVLYSASTAKAVLAISLHQKFIWDAYQLNSHRKLARLSEGYIWGLGSTNVTKLFML
jgi:hypothetical protein